MKAFEVNLGMRNWQITESVMNHLQMWDDTKVLPFDGFTFYLVTFHYDEALEYIKQCCPEAEITEK